MPPRTPQSIHTGSPLCDVHGLLIPRSAKQWPAVIAMPLPRCVMVQKFGRERPIASSKGR